MYKRRNEIERLFQRIFSRFEKLAPMFLGSSASYWLPMAFAVGVNTP